MLNANFIRAFFVWTFAAALCLQASGALLPYNTTTNATEPYTSGRGDELGGPGNPLTSIAVRGTIANVRIGDRRPLNIWSEADIVAAFQQADTYLSSKSPSAPLLEEKFWGPEAFYLYVYPTPDQLDLTYDLAARSLDVLRIFILSKQEFGPRTGFVQVQGKTVAAIGLDKRSGSSTS